MRLGAAIVFGIAVASIAPPADAFVSPRWHAPANHGLLGAWRVTIEGDAPFDLEVRFVFTETTLTVEEAHSKTEAHEYEVVSHDAKGLTILVHDEKKAPSKATLVWVDHDTIDLSIEELPQHLLLHRVES